MTTPATNDPVKEPARIAEIARLCLHTDIVDEVLNEYVNKAATEFDLPVGLVSIVLDGVQKFAASHGLQGWIAETNGTPVEWSLCANSVRTKQPFVVEDAEADEKTKDNPLVSLDNLGCYAGAPLVSKNGFIVGNFCVIGDKARAFSDQEVERLKEFAALAMSRIEERICKDKS